MSLAADATPDEVLIDRDDGCALLFEGVLISIWLASLHDELLPEIERAVSVAAERCGGGVALLSLHRLDRRFPIGPSVTSNLGNIRDTMATIRPRVKATSTVLEFNGFLAATLRIAATGILKVAAPSLPARFFSSRVEATQWVLPHVPAPASELRRYLDALTRADGLLARRAHAPRPPRSSPPSP